VPKGRSPNANNQFTPESVRLTDDDMPKYLTGRSADVWSENLPRLHWLTKTDGPLFSTWCALQAAFESAPDEMHTARLAQLRLLASDLGLTGSGRARLGVGVEPPGAEDDDPAAKYLR